ncbi:armadillo-type protein [Pelagophyceae sp. CCMP2097]|nr:armadillo-type protein [Pelagophyceae sp. CCMP2097]|mmetsp:Transcript_32776/g.110432  ORF Transcript_32776/g.110432 Transcript_32776/m.110432 type:complete len:331 (-) Transcript_32776:65-1057(-)|eukprot:CAMPEP_0184084116 /NCGR_PEP_ID=MMETSP0974-20121125/4046_1 /TAXON_ID=483370 /ORGANISM="non described non described, Strain CCMP2097" /LENGTH=330 /DNA_ID=CAMNT_0026386793 /DNA_START=69 /DNA_END=1061 /DNA_ORIENTATION=-
MSAFAGLTALYVKATTEETPEARVAAAAELGAAIKEAGVASVVEMNLIGLVAASLADLKSVPARDGAIAVVHALITALGLHAEPYVLKMLPGLIETYDDKVKVVTASADACLTAFFQSVNAYAAGTLLPYVFAGMATSQWKIKVGCLKLLGVLAHTAPTQVGQLLPEIVPKVTDNMWDTKPEVKKAAKDSLGECCTVIHNPDVQPIVPILISANANPKENVLALDRLMGTTFVSQVDRPTLAIIVPVLGRGLRDRDVQTKRKCCVVIDNMCKLVCDAKDVEPFVKTLLPELKRVEEEVPIPEIRAYGAKARATLIKAIKDGGGVIPDNLQ